MSLTFPAPPPTLAATSDGRALPVRRLFCGGRNYAAHARETGRDPEREPPFFFTKWSDTVVSSGAAIAYPLGTANFQYEAELVVAIGSAGHGIAPHSALDHVGGYASGLDMTRRDLQLEARDKGRPWNIGKNVEQSSPLGLIHPVAEVGHPSSGPIRLFVNDALRQDADLAEIIWPAPDVISYISRFYHLEAGGLIYTGTPANVGPVVPTDKILVSIASLSNTRISVATPPAAGPRERG